MDIGSLTGTLELEDNFTSKIGNVALSLVSLGDKMKTGISGISDETAKGLDTTTDKVKGFAEVFGNTLKEAAENPVAAFQNLSKEIGEKFLDALKMIGPGAALVTGGLVALAGSVVAVGAAVFAFAKNAAEAGEAVLGFSDQTGIAVENVGALEFAAKSVGASLNQVKTVMKFIERGSADADAATGKFGKALEDLGINAKQFIALDSESKLFRLAEGLRRGSDSGRLMADAMTIMGRQGAEAITWVNDLTPEMLKLGETMGIAWNQKLVEQAEAFNIQLNEFKTALSNVGTQIGIAVLPKVEELLRKFLESPASFQKLLEATDTLAHTLGLLVAVSGLVITYVGKMGQEILVQAGRAALAWQTLFPSKENMARVVAIAEALKTVTGATDMTYNASKDLAKALNDVNLAMDKGIKGATNPAANKQTKDLKDQTDAAKAAAKAFDDMYESLTGKKAQEQADLMERALQEFYAKGLAPTTKQMEDWGKKAQAFVSEGMKIGPMLQDALEQAALLDGTFQKFVITTGYVTRTVAGVTGVWQEFKLGLAPIPESFTKISSSATDVALSINRINDPMRIWDAELKKLDLKNRTIDLQNYGAAVSVVGQAIGGFVGQAVSGLGQVIQQWAAFNEKARDAEGNIIRLTKAQRTLALAQGVSEVIGATGGGSTGSRVASGALAGAGAGLLFAPETLGLSIAIGASVGALVGLMRGLSAQAKETRDVVSGFVNSFRDGMEGLINRVQSLGTEGEGLLNNLLYARGQNDKDAALKAIKAIQQALDDLDRDIQRYGLTWADMLNPIDRIQGSNRAAQGLLDTIRRLTAAGYNMAAITRGMAGDVNDWLAATLKAGLKIPPAMAPIIEQLIRMGMLTEENARLMLGMADDGVPSLDDITAACERWGISLDAAGRKVQQLRFTDLAKKIAADFALLTAAGVPFEVMLNSSVDGVESMQQAIQRMVDAARGPLGISLPESMRPILERMMQAGLLTDEFGTKLTTLDGINFEEPLTAAIDALILRLGELIDTILGVGSAAAGLGDFVTTPPLGTAGPPPPLSPRPRPPSSSAGGTPPPGEPENPGGGASPSGQREFVLPITLNIGNEAVAREVIRTLVNVGT